MEAIRELRYRAETEIPIEDIIGPLEERYLASGYKMNSNGLSEVTVENGSGRAQVQVNEIFYENLGSPYHYSSIDSLLVSKMLGRKILEQSGIVKPEASLSVAAFTFAPRLRIVETTFPCSGEIVYAHGPDSRVQLQVGGEQNFLQTIVFTANADQSRVGDVDLDYVLGGYQQTDLKISPIVFSDGMIKAKVSLTNDEVIEGNQKYPFSMFDVTLLGQLLQAHICRYYGLTRPEIGTTWLLNFDCVRIGELNKPYNIPVSCQLKNTRTWTGTHSRKKRQSFTASLQVGGAYRASISLACSVPESEAFRMTVDMPGRFRTIKASEVSVLDVNRTPVL